MARYRCKPTYEGLKARDAMEQPPEDSTLQAYL